MSVTAPTKTFDRAVIHDEALLQIVAVPAVRGTVNDLPDSLPILRVNALHDQREGWRDLLGKAEYPVGFFRPGVLFGQDIPAETAGTAQALCFREICFAPAQRMLCPHPFGSLLSFAQRTKHRRDQPRQPGLENIISSAHFKRFDGNFFAQGSGYKNEWHLRAKIHGELQCGKTIEGRKGVVRQNEIDSALLQRGQEGSLSIDSRQFAGDAFGFEQSLDKLRVMRIVFQRKNV
jgi:hypothetical protein